MCLNTIYRKEILSEDLIVYKVVGVDEHRHSFFGIVLIKYPEGICGKLKIKRVKKGINVADTSKILLSFDDYTRYSSGFHCNTSRNSCEGQWGFFKIRCSNTKIKEFTIPKGTEIVFGGQSGYDVVVTPILLNKGGK